jgi:DeoR family transcriptional regulator, aga operon transcriptional repressor
MATDPTRPTGAEATDGRFANGELTVAQRRDAIATVVFDREFARVADLSEWFGVSSVTVRLDLEALEAEGRVRRVRGGAIRGTYHPTPELPSEEAGSVATFEKAAIGAHAASLIRSGSTLMMDVGTTTRAAAAALARRSDLSGVTVFTNGLEIARALEPAIPRLTVVVTGGTLRRMQHSLVNPLGTVVLEGVRAEVLFLGCNGVHEELGVSNVNLEEAEIKRAMIRQADRVVLLAHGSKVGAHQMARICGVDDLDLLVTGPSADPEALAALRRAGLQVDVVEE